ncbi:helix-turn-helix transcriptional regulator [Danxiaibacter flavus]|uniref:Helix-turn-helix transcriptional regulator n=1 Tax=Danxiaibacter flavus TaxID=3049108 RepID=A0ABV3Z8K0_9BACT|nr:helix-turn-helix transcriptional regulator [Chitinophagaceae bacterium DXS]
MEKAIHQGRNIKRFREMLGIKQEALALELGEDWNQRKISLLEQKEEVDEQLLKQIASVLKVPVEAIKNFDTEQAIHNINNNFHDNAIQNQINPIERIIELYEVKIVALYERLLQAEKEKNDLLERVLDKLKQM